MRAILAPSTARLLLVYLKAQGDDFGNWLSGARRHLSPEDQEALAADMAELEFVSGWQRAWLASDVGRSELPTVPLARRSSHDEISTAEAAAMLGLTDRTVRSMLDRGELLGRKLNPRSWAVARASVEHHIERTS